MDPARLRAAETVFQRLADLPATEREPVLDRDCKNDPELRACVEALLAHHDSGMGEFLQSPPASSAAPDWGAEGYFPKQIGRYEITRALGEGGMGVVYEARQTQPTRAVALKVLRPGVMTRGTSRRFQYEVELLGRLDHSGIAKVYEAGVAEVPLPGGGTVRQPFFAMELVHGRALNEHVREFDLTAGERLELLCRVCDAVHHAHQKGIIHRDLKPTNILVTDAAGNATTGFSHAAGAKAGRSGQPKILDFGVARTTDIDIQMTTMHTQTGQIVGTIAYMSPEQAAGDLQQLDIRSDVYALGVIGYELLTGKIPQGLTEVPYTEAIRRIREEEPETLGRVNKAFCGDLEIIFTKALEKDRERRYASAAEFAADMRRYLANEPIAARRPSTIYQVRKLAARHKAASASLAVLVAVLIAFSVWMGLLYRRADRLRAAADREAVRARQTQGFLENMLASIDPEVARGRDTTILRGILAEAAEKVGDQLALHPEAEADIRATIGAAYLSVGLAAAAEPQLEAALAIRQRVFGETHESVAELTRLLAESAGKQGDRERAEDLARRALALRREQFSDGGVEVAETMHTLAWILSELSGKHDEAAALLRQSLEVVEKHEGRRHRLYAQGLHNLGIVLWRWGRFDEAEAAARDALALKTELLGTEHPSVASAMDLLGQILATRKRYDAAEPLIRESLEMHRRLFGEDHPSYVTALNSLTQLIAQKGDYAGAEPLARQCLDAMAGLRGEGSHETAFATMNLANILDKKGDHEEAERYYRVADERFRNVFPPDHPYVHSPLTRLAEMLDRIARHEAAEPLWRQLVDETQRAFPPGHANRRIMVAKVCGLGKCLAKLQRCDEAETALIECREGHREIGGANDSLARDAAEALVQLYDQCGRAEEAEALRAALHSSTEQDLSTATPPP